MKGELTALSNRYLAALQKHLKQGPRANSEPAHRLGREAVALGLETLDIAKIHERAIATLDGQASQEGLTERANVFFTDAISPIEETHRDAIKTSARVSQLNDKIRQRTVEVAASNRSLRQGIAKRKTVELALKKSVDHYKTLLEESLSLQEHLRRLTHRILSAQENKRGKISHDLQDEIAQTLLGINVRLLTVKKGAGRDAKSLQKELASTQRLVDISVKTIQRFAREYANAHEP